MQKLLLSILAAALAAVALPAGGVISSLSQTQIVEFYNAGLDHYFISADPKEIADLDTGVHTGWARTGLTFQALKAGATLTNSSPVCRFYGKPEAGLDSHFYSASPTECAAVQEKFATAWQFESAEVFRAYLVDPNTGKCPSDTGPIYRLYNKRADVNHRYTDQLSVFQAMVAKGYVAEGDGNPQLPVAFCMPIGGPSATPAPSAPGTPTCTINASTTTPAVGGFLALTTVCTNAPTSYSWVGCASTTGACQATSNAAGAATYTVTGTNSIGAGAAASITVNWQGASGPVPVCTLSGTTTTPAVGSALGLVANCSQTPTRYDWLECNYLLQNACNPIASCSSSSASCTLTGAFAGYAHYALQAANSAGVGAVVGFDVEWKSGGGTTTPTVPICSLSASNTTPLVNGTVTLSASCSGNPSSYVWTGCSSTGASCSTSSSTTGSKTFTVVASNATGNSAPAGVTVTWQAQPVPNCSVSSSKSAPLVGETITLSASCSGSPTSYQWSGCAGSGAQCTAAEGAAGVKTYSVIATNSAGAGSSAGATVNWQAPPTSPPVCTISTSNASPFTGSPITLTASCNNSPSSYSWTGCSSTTATCVATSATAGAVAYGVSAANVVGKGATASTTVNWQQSTAPPDFCSAYTDVVRINMPWSGGPTYPTDYGGSFRAKEVLVIGITVPGSAANAPNKLFSASVTEYGGSPTFRDMRLSLSPCDFSRAVDPTGQNGPISAGYNGQTVSVSGTVGFNMQPGQTYYISIRNWSNATGLTCQTATCNILVGYQWPL